MSHSESIPAAQRARITDPLVLTVLENEHERRQSKYHAGPRKPPTIKAHCSRGHARTPENVRVYEYGAVTVRQCLKCAEILKAVKKEKQRILERDAVQVLRKYGIPATARPLKTEAAA